MININMKLFELSSFENWFSGSKVVDKNGNPLRVYHGTNSDINAFHAGSHFGTATAAKQRVRHKYGKKKEGRTYPVYLNIKNPLRVSDMIASDEAALHSAICAGKFPDIDRDVSWKEGAYKAAEKAGYDGLVYKNNIEDRGKLSWVIFHPSQARFAFSPIDENINDDDDESMEKLDYMSGKCHVFAIAMNRLYGFGFLVLTDKSERYSKGRYFPTVAAVHHVYAIDKAGNAYDCLGKHDAANIIAQWKNIDAGSWHRPGVVRIATEAGLRKYVGEHPDDWSRPLEAYSDADVEVAMIAAEKIAATSPSRSPIDENINDDDDDDEWQIPELKEYILPAGTTLFHGTSAVFSSKNDLLESPCWVSTSIAVAKFFVDYHNHSPKGKRRIIQYVTTYPLTLLKFEGRKTLNDLDEYHGIYTGDPHEMAEGVTNLRTKSGKRFDGWIIEDNYLDGDDIMLANSNVLGFVKTMILKS